MFIYKIVYNTNSLFSEYIASVVAIAYGAGSEVAHNVDVVTLGLGDTTSQIGCRFPYHVDEAGRLPDKARSFKLIFAYCFVPCFGNLFCWFFKNKNQFQKSNNIN